MERHKEFSKMPGLTPIICVFVFCRRNIWWDEKFDIVAVEKDGNVICRKGKI